MELPRLREWRHRRALSQRELAARAKVGYTTINRLEQGVQKAHPGTVRRIADALGVNPEDLQLREERRDQRELLNDMDSPQLPTQLGEPMSVYYIKKGSESDASAAHLDQILAARFRLVQEAPGVIYLVEINDELDNEPET